MAEEAPIFIGNLARESAVIDVRDGQSTINPSHPTSYVGERSHVSGGRMGVASSSSLD
jgi:hypothetical protein